jgi:hypothetical protein
MSNGDNCDGIASCQAWDQDRDQDWDRDKSQDQD